MTDIERGRKIDWRAVVLSGLIAGLVFLIVEMVLVPVIGGSAWATMRMMAGIVMGAEVLTPLETFDPGVFVVAMLVHFFLAVGYAGVLGLIVRGHRLKVAVVIGAGYGVGLYLINYYVLAGVFPWFAEARHWVRLVSHPLFGAVAAAAFIWISRPSARPTMAATRSEAG